MSMEAERGEAPTGTGRLRGASTPSDIPSEDGLADSCQSIMISLVT